MEYKECNIKGFEGLYHIYENGDIYSIRSKRLIKLSLNNRLYGYLYVCLIGHGKYNYLRTGVHRIVAHHWVSPCPGKGYEVNHKDLDKTNNHYTNLEWVTHQHNMLHARKIENWKSGRKKGYKTTEETKQLQSIAKMKKVRVYNDNEELIFQSINEFCESFSTYRKLFDRYVNSHKTFKGYKIRYL